MKPFATAMFLCATLCAAQAVAMPPIERIKLPPGFKIEVYAEKVENARSLALGDAEHLLLSSRDERRFHVTESHIPPGGSAGEEQYTLPADVELVYVLSGSLELRVGDEVHELEQGDTLTYSPRDPHTWRNPSATDEAIVLWTALPNPYGV